VGGAVGCLRAGVGSRASLRRTQRNRRAPAAVLPPTLVQVEHPAGLLRELWVAWEDPRAVVPGANRVLTEPPPDRDRRDLSDDHAPYRLPRQLSAGPARDRDAVLGRRLACQRLDLGHLRRGKDAPRRPGRGLSSRPCSPSSQNRCSHVETGRRDYPSRSAISVLANPSAANKIAFARTTSR
jgi:hypothetical protein